MRVLLAVALCNATLSRHINHTRLTSTGMPHGSLSSPLIVLPVTWCTFTCFQDCGSFLETTNFASRGDSLLSPTTTLEGVSIQSDLYAKICSPSAQSHSEHTICGMHLDSTFSITCTELFRLLLPVHLNAADLWIADFDNVKDLQPKP